jgi:signal transduction histidine kinase/CheY-like chemotaxis protein
VGLCGRGQIGFVMSSRFGFAIYSKDRVDTLMVPRPVIVARDTPLLDVLQKALLRQGEDFREDVILVDKDQRLVGLIKVEVLAELQSRLFSAQLNELRRQRDELRRRNLELFNVNHVARQTKGLFLGLFAAHTLAVALLDEDGVVHEHNGRLTELLRLEVPGAAAGSIIKWIVEGEREPFLSLLRSHARGLPAASNQEVRFEISGLGIRLIRCNMGWIRETGQICVCLDDVTEQRTLEQTVLRQEKQTLLDTLVGGIAHELNNKMAPIMGFAELMRFEGSANSSEYISLIINSVREAARIIRQLLELSKPATQQTQVLDLRAIVDETLAILKFQLRETGCTVKNIAPPGPVPVVGDPGQLKQVALNLAINALHAMEATQDPLLTLEVRCSGSDAELVVSDNGCGIQPENMSRIFDPFFTTKGPERGTGLGLSVCYSIVRQLGGNIDVRSTPGVGTRFTVCLRLESEASPQAGSDRQVPVSAFPSGLEGTRVLIVEDEIVIRRLLQEILCTRFGCTAVLVSNGVEALAALERDQFSMVLSDVRMPLMNGKEFYAQMRERHPDLSRRFVFITGHAGDKKLSADITRWNIPVITKPFTFDRLAEVCAPILQDLSRSRS